MNLNLPQTGVFSSDRYFMNDSSAAQHPKLFQFLGAIDDDLATQCRVLGCRFCGGVLHSARYPRKPRADPTQLDATAPTTRQSFCCDRCRRRTTPASVSFLGRRVYPGLVVVLLSAMQSGVTNKTVQDLRSSLGVARRTLQRWRRWWRECFVRTQFWQIEQGRFMPIVESGDLPASLLNRFLGCDARSRLINCLRFLSPLTIPGAIKLNDVR